MSPACGGSVQVAAKVFGGFPAEPPRKPELDAHPGVRTAAQGVPASPGNPDGGGELRWGPVRRAAGAPPIQGEVFHLVAS